MPAAHATLLRIGEKLVGRENLVDGLFVGGTGVQLGGKMIDAGRIGRSAQEFRQPRTGRLLLVLVAGENLGGKPVSWQK